MGHMMLPPTLPAKQDVWDGMHYMPYLSISNVSILFTNL